MSTASLTPHRFGVPSHARQIGEAVLKKAQAWAPESKRTHYPMASGQQGCSPGSIEICRGYLGNCRPP